MGGERKLMYAKNKLGIRMRRKSPRGTVISANFYRRHAYKAKFYRRRKFRK